MKVKPVDEATMYQKDLVTLISRETGFFATHVKEIVKAYHEIVVRKLLEGHTIKLRNFMYYTTKITPKREFRHMKSFTDGNIINRKGGGNRRPIATWAPAIIKKMKDLKDYYPEENHD